MTAATTVSPVAPPSTATAEPPNVNLAFAIARSLAPTRVSDRALRAAPLGAIIAVQIFLLARLPSTAWGDEGLYITAGRRWISHWLHGTNVAQFHYDSFFSGAPWAYPVIAGALDEIGGLGAARWFSAACMIAATLFVYGTTRHWFGTAAATYAAALFAVAPSISFLGFFATYDALCLALLAAALYLTVTRKSVTSAALAAVLEVVAVTVKYAGALWVPFIICCGLFSAWKVRRRRAVLRASVNGVLVGGLVVAVFATVGRSLISGIVLTTTQRRVLLPSAPSYIAEQSLRDIGVVLIAAGFGLALLLRDSRRSVVSWLFALTVAAGGVVAPLHQIDIGEQVAIHKHSGFGLIFLAPFAGLAIARLATKPVGRLITVIVLLVITLYSANRSYFIYTRNNISPQIISVAQGLVNGQLAHAGGQIASTDPETFGYYTRTTANRLQWVYGSISATEHSKYRAILVSNNFPPNLVHSSPISMIDAALRNRNYTLVYVAPLRPGYSTLKWYLFIRNY